MKQFFEDFKKFISKGSILDMAIGVVIGGAFGKIVTSLVNDIITPLISFLTGKVMLSDLKWVFHEAILDAQGKIIRAESALTYGNFLQAIIDFMIISFSIFLVLRFIMNAQKKIEALTKKPIDEPVVEPTTKICPFCQSEISIKATRCPHCTSQLEE